MYNKCVSIIESYKNNIVSIKIIIKIIVKIFTKILFMHLN